MAVCIFFFLTQRFYHSNALKTHFIYQLQAIESSFFFRKMHTYLTYQFYMLTSTCAFLIIILSYLSSCTGLKLEGQGQPVSLKDWHCFYTISSEKSTVSRYTSDGNIHYIPCLQNANHKFKVR